MPMRGGYADKVFITLEGENHISDGSSYSYEYDGSNVDGAIFVVRQDQAKMDVLQEGMEMFSGTGVHMMGSVLNNAVAGITSYGYGYGYGYGYRHGSGKEKNGKRTGDN